MLKRTFSVALLSGFIAGIAVTGFQTILVTPLILKAESYERKSSAFIANRVPYLLKVIHPGKEHVVEGETEWIPGEGGERLFYTAGSNIVTGVAFALLLVGVYVLRGKPVDFNSGLLWGVAGFVVFSAAPALGLPPELPGMTGAILGNRQLWWTGTVLATALGLGIFIENLRLLPRLIALAFIALPHIVGAPHTMLFNNLLPAELSAQFVVATLATAAMFWMVLGGASGFFFQRFFQADLNAVAEPA